MKKLFAVILVLLLAISLPAQVKIGGTGTVGGTTKAGVSAVIGGASLNRGFNFRFSDTFVTDGANTTYVRGAVDDYPKTRLSVTFGWVADGGSYPSAVDRDSGADARFAGINYQSNNGARPSFQVDLPTPGTYTLHLALGDISFGQGYTYVEIYDNTTLKVTIDKNTAIGAGHFWDATGVDRTAAAWPGNNVSIAVAFATTTLKIKLGSPAAQADSSCIAHLYID